MALTDKYQSLIDIGNQNGVNNLQAAEQDGSALCLGLAANGDVKQKMWDEYNRIDPELPCWRSGSEHRGRGWRIRGVYRRVRRQPHEDREALEQELERDLDANRAEVPDYNKIYPATKTAAFRGKTDTGLEFLRRNFALGFSDNYLGPRAFRSVSHLIITFFGRKHRFDHLNNSGGQK